MVSVVSIPQLKDNYSYIVLNNKSGVVIDPAESLPILEYFNKNKISLKAILLTHHHLDHTGGVEGILKITDVPIYSPNKNINFTTNILIDKDVVDLDFFKFEVIATPGHTLDHVAFYIKESNILFSGDALFRLGCGKVFEGTYKQMFDSLKRLGELDDKTSIYCGHEYSNTNINFLLSVFQKNIFLLSEKDKINYQIKNTGSSVPFNLAKERKINPFLRVNSDIFNDFKKDNNLTDFKLFCF